MEPWQGVCAAGHGSCRSTGKDHSAPTPCLHHTFAGTQICLYCHRHQRRISNAISVLHDQRGPPCPSCRGWQGRAAHLIDTASMGSYPRYTFAPSSPTRCMTSMPASHESGQCGMRSKYPRLEEGGGQLSSSGRAMKFGIPAPICL